MHSCRHSHWDCLITAFIAADTGICRRSRTSRHAAAACCTSRIHIGCTAVAGSCLLGAASVACTSRFCTAPVACASRFCTAPVACASCFRTAPVACTGDICPAPYCAARKASGNGCPGCIKSIAVAVPVHPVAAVRAAVGIGPAHCIGFCPVTPCGCGGKYIN